MRSVTKIRHVGQTTSTGDATGHPFLFGSLCGFGLAAFRACACPLFDGLCRNVAWTLPIDAHCPRLIAGNGIRLVLDGCVLDLIPGVWAGSLKSFEAVQRRTGGTIRCAVLSDRATSMSVCVRNLCGNRFVLDYLGTNGVQGSGQSGQKSVRFVGNRRFGSRVGGNGLTLGFGNLARDELVESFIGFGY